MKRASPRAAWGEKSVAWGAPQASWGGKNATRGAPREARGGKNVPRGPPHDLRGGKNEARGTPRGSRGEFFDLWGAPQTARGAPHDSWGTSLEGYFLPPETAEAGFGAEADEPGKGAAPGKREPTACRTRSPECPEQAAQIDPAQPMLNAGKFQKSPRAVKSFSGGEAGQGRGGFILSHSSSSSSSSSKKTQRG